MTASRRSQAGRQTRRPDPVPQWPGVLVTVGLVAACLALAGSALALVNVLRW